MGGGGRKWRWGLGQTELGTGDESLMLSSQKNGEVP